MKLSDVYNYLANQKDGTKKKLLYKIFRLYFNIFPPKYKEKSEKRLESNCIVSLTSYPSRIKTVYLTINTLLNQSVKTNSVILWLAKEQFPNEEVGLPKRLLKLKAHGLDIKFCDDLKSHKKYFYSIQKYSEHTIITVDDDMLYPEDLVENLLECSKENPGAVCCYWAHEIHIEDGTISSYSKWEKGIEKSDMPSYYVLPVGCGGVLYPPHCLDLRAFSKEKINELCINSDDLWLKSMSILNKTKAVRVRKKPIFFFSLFVTQRVGLYHENTDNNKNDEALLRIINEYPEIVFLICEE